MKILAFDTSSDACSVALQVDDQLLVDHRLAAQQHAALLLPMINALMSDAGLTPTQLDGLIYGRGPGSFTGVRIAVACAQGIALGADIGAVGISTLQTIGQGAYRAHNVNRVSIGIDARMDEVYFCEYQLDDNQLMQPCLDEQIGSAENLMRAGPGHWAGTGVERYAQHLLENERIEASKILKGCLAQAQDLITIGEASVIAGELESPELASPVYLRNKVALTTAERDALRSSK